MTVAPSVAPLAGLGGVSLEELSAELDRWAERTVGEAASTAPEGVNVRTRTRSGHIGEQIVAEIESGDYDLVVLGSRGRGRLASELFGSANGYVHFHSRIPLLSISDPDAEADATPESTLVGSARS